MFPRAFRWSLKSVKCSRPHKSWKKLHRKFSIGTRTFRFAASFFFGFSNVLSFLRVLKSEIKIKIKNANDGDERGWDCCKTDEMKGVLCWVNEASLPEEKKVAPSFIKWLKVLRFPRLFLPPLSFPLSAIFFGNSSIELSHLATGWKPDLPVFTSLQHAKHVETDKPFVYSSLYSEIPFSLSASIFSFFFSSASQRIAIARKIIEADFRPILEIKNKTHKIDRKIDKDKSLLT